MRPSIPGCIRTSDLEDSLAPRADYVYVGVFVVSLYECNSRGVALNAMTAPVFQVVTLITWVRDDGEQLPLSLHCRFVPSRQDSGSIEHFTLVNPLRCEKTPDLFGKPRSFSSLRMPSSNSKSTLSCSRIAASLVLSSSPRTIWDRNSIHLPCWYSTAALSRLCLRRVKHFNTGRC